MQGKRTSGDGKVERDAQGVPVAFRLFHVGDNPLTQGGEFYTLTLSESNIRTIARNYARKGVEIPVDAKHLMVAIAQAMGTEEADLAKSSPLLFRELANGMSGIELRETADGPEIWARISKWSDAAVAAFSGKVGIMAYYSPTLRPARFNPETNRLEIVDESALRVSSITLTNEPALNGLPALAASESGKTGGNDFAFAVLALSANPAVLEATHTKETGIMKKMLLALAELIGFKDVVALSDDKADHTPLVEQAINTIKAHRAEVGQFVAGLADALGVKPDATLSLIQGKVLSLAEAAKANGTTVAALTERLSTLEGAEKARFIAALQEQGKLTPAMLDWAKSQTVLALTEWSKAAPVIVPKQIVPLDDLNKGGEALTMTDTEIRVARSCGLDPADVAKSSGKKMPATAGFIRLQVLSAVVAIFAILLGLARAANLTMARNTPDRSGASIMVGVQSGVVIYAGAMTAICTTNGLAEPATNKAKQMVIGRAQSSVDTTGAGLSTTKTITIDRGILRWENGGTNTDANIGSTAYVLDDNTVTGAIGQTNKAGTIIDVDADGVWVDHNVK